jgi:hypothetical protein
MRRPLPLSLNVLLHVLLSLALVANGIGAAMASAHAGCAHSATAVELSDVDSSVKHIVVDEPPCHGDMAHEASSPPMHDDERTSLHAADVHGSDGDCGSTCKNACGCACTAHVQAALMPPTLLLRASARIAHAETFAYAYAAPALPHPVRPPIG